MNSRLSDNLREKFYIKLYFNIRNGFELAGIRRAFLDFSRTLKIKDESRTDLKQKAEKYILVELKTILERQLTSQEEFDNQHKAWCKGLKLIWDELSFGQTQKWINMTLKYWLLFGNKRIKGIDLNSKYYHIPIDNNVLKGMFGVRNPNPWSRISDYDIYMKYQLEHRMKNTGNYPIIDEFIFFNDYEAN
ncbi:MAG: hypothetical protein M0Q53_02500 [Prolixibacteraceae bacterium]|jgi:hypothetical protein|nr:hypothetical protein [Prolixibacteraceae bacterium]